MRAEELRAHEEALVAAIYWNENVRPGTRVRVKGLPKRIRSEPGTTVGQAFVHEGIAVCRVRHAEIRGVKPICPIASLKPIYDGQILDIQKPMAAELERHRQNVARRSIEDFNARAPIGTEVRIYSEGGLSTLIWVVDTRAFLGKSGPVVAVRCPSSRQSRTVDVLDVVVRDAAGGAGVASCRWIPVLKTTPEEE